MGSRWQLRVPRSEGERVCDPVRGVIHNMHRIELPRRVERWRARP